MNPAFTAIVPAELEATAKEILGLPTDDPKPEPTPPDPKKLSRKELGKLRRQYVTVVHPRVQPCGHKYIHDRFPKEKCDICWFAWFNQHGELVQGLDELMSKEGEAGFIQIHGRRFFNRFVTFMATMARVKEIMGSQGAPNVNGLATTGSDNSTPVAA